MGTIGDFTVERISGSHHNLSEFAGKVVLVVNVASQCGNTPQYEGLEKLHETYADRGFAALGFPCNQFGGQEPGTSEEIVEFCTVNFGVKFPLFGKVEVNGEGANPLFKWLKRQTPASNDREVEWNFVKFLVGRDGKPIRRYGDKVMPGDIAADIEAAL